MEPGLKNTALDGRRCFSMIGQLSELKPVVTTFHSLSIFYRPLFDLYSTFLSTFLCHDRFFEEDLLSKQSNKSRRRKSESGQEWDRFIKIIQIVKKNLKNFILHIL